MESTKIEEKFVDTGRGKIFYWSNLSFRGRPTVVFLHGLSSNHTTWLKAMKFFSKKKFNVLALDLRGHGLSDKSKNKKNYILDVFSGDLGAIMKKEEIKNAVFVGYSFGGQVAIDYISKNPERAQGLVLISVNHSNPLEYHIGLKFLTPIVTGVINLAAFFVLWQKRKEYYYYEHGKSVGYWDSVFDGFKTMPLSVNFWMLAGVFEINFKDTVKKIKAPTVIIAGKKDPLVTRREINDMTKAMKGAEVVVSKSSGHFVGTNAQDEVIEILMNFLNNKILDYENSDF